MAEILTLQINEDGRCAGVAIDANKQEVLLSFQRPATPDEIENKTQCAVTLYDNGKAETCVILSIEAAYAILLLLKMKLQEYEEKWRT